MALPMFISNVPVNVVESSIHAILPSGQLGGVSQVGEAAAGYACRSGCVRFGGVDGQSAERSPASGDPEGGAKR